MGKERIYELAKELNVASKDIVTIAKKTRHRSQKPYVIS
ncbi:translation initiation factor IF-2 N-terminal domain-containing protein [Paucilactobacillus hokkaidonensis]|nr:translation initiation factor IF-2 N-terminal domain-containing protein [Paucilactobacillus hokkaidonensis]